MKKTISAYTPSNTDPETRERIFVQQHQLLRQTVDGFEQSMLNATRHHVLFVGPRGIGKTHLVSMVHDRLSKRPELADKMRIAWLGEDNVYTGYIDFALAIADELSEAYPDEFRFDYRGHAGSLSPDDAAEVILNKVVDHLGDKSILLIMENLHRAFNALGDVGQKKWHAFLQEKGRLAILATSPQLFEEVSNQQAVFFNFFDIMHLSPLSVDEARELIRKIASEKNRTDLVRFLDTPEGRYRVRALHHLAGGNHRMYILLSEFLTKESLDGLVASLEQLADELTPYFQERIGSLPPQQAKIVQALCNASGAMTVREVARNTFIPEATVSRQLSDLRAKHYVISEKRGSVSYYEMAEPLMRLSLEVKKQRGKPLRLAVSFLRAWFTLGTLAEDGSDAKDATALAYKEAAVHSDGAIQQAICRNLESEFESQISYNRFNEAIKIAEELTVTDESAGLLMTSLVLTKKGENEKALGLIESTEALRELGIDAPPERRAIALTSRGLIYGQLGETEKAVADFSIVIEMPGAPLGLRAEALFNRGVTYERSDLRRAIADYSSVIEMPGAPSIQRAKALVNRSVVHCRLRETEKAIADFSSVIEMSDAPPELRTRALFGRGVMYGQLGRPKKAVADYTSVIEMPDSSLEYKAGAANWRGFLNLESGKFEQSAKDFAMVAGMNGVSSYSKTFALFYLPEAMMAVRPFEEAVTSIQRAFESGDPAAKCYGGRPGNILRHVLNRDHSAWPRYVERLVPVYGNAKALNALGSGLTESIRSLDKGGYSNGQLELWNSSWQKYGAGHDELALPLSVIDAATRVLKSGEDQSLFDLPLEIRKIVRPLLESTLAKTGRRNSR